MKTRLAQIIDYKTGGRKKDFADLCGWTPQYLTKLLAGENFGLQPVLAIVNAVPEIDARWLLTGDGKMIDPRDGIIDHQRELISFIKSWTEYEVLIPAMTPEQCSRLADAIANNSLPHFEPSELDEIKSRLSYQKEATDAKFAAAMRNAEQIQCKHKTPRK